MRDMAYRRSIDCARILRRFERDIPRSGLELFGVDLRHRGRDVPLSRDRLPINVRIERRHHRLVEGDICSGDVLQEMGRVRRSGNGHQRVVPMQQPCERQLARGTPDLIGELAEAVDVVLDEQVAGAVGLDRVVARLQQRRVAGLAEEQELEVMTL